MNKFKEELAKLRLEEQRIKSEAGKLGDITHSVRPEDLIVMYAGKMADLLIEQRVRSENTLSSYMRAYEGIISGYVEEALKSQVEDLERDFAKSKRRIMRITEAHPLWETLGGIKGFSSYMMALLMSYIKDVSRFETPSKLCVYAGIASINGIPVCKAKLNEIKLHYSENGGEFNGFNTRLSGRLFVLAESFIRARGFFYNYYLGIKERLVQRAINNDEVEERSDKVLIMKGKKNQPLKAWAHANARRRMLRTFLHIFWTEWRTLNGMEVRVPYAIDYLGHSRYVKLEDVLKVDEK